VKTDREVKNIFFNLETKAELLNYQIQGFPIYFILRFSLEMDYRHYYDNPPRNPKLIQRAKRIIKDFLQPLFLNLKPQAHLFISDNLHNVATSKFLFVSTSPLVRQPGESLELYDLVQHYYLKGETINFVQPDYGRLIEKQPYHQGFYSINPEEKVSLSIRDKRIIIELITVVSAGLKFNFKPLIQNYFEQVSRNISLCLQLQKIIEACKPTFVFARSIYTEPWVVLACKQSGVQCVEVQHGVVAKDNIYYQTILTEELREKYLPFPDYILTMGDEWRKITLKYFKAFNSSHVITLGVKENLNYKSNSISEKFSILICLQHGLFQIDDFIFSFLRKYGKAIEKNKCIVIVRPHPGNIAGSTKQYNTYPKVVVQSPEEIPLSDAFSDCNLLLSPSSMCLYEAIARGIPTASFDQFRGVTIPRGIRYLSDIDDLWQFITQVQNGEYQQIKIPYINEFNTQVLDKFIQ